jgi:hypothetical protein
MAKRSTGTRPAALLDPIQIDTPLVTQNNLVREDSSGSGTGFICARGLVLNSGLGPPNEVWGKILGASENVICDDANCPPSGATQGGVYAFTWWIENGQSPGNDIPNASCGGTGAPVNNRLWIGVNYAGSPRPWHCKIINFPGVCSTLTECEVIASAAGAVIQGSQGVDIAPYQWRAELTGGGGWVEMFGGGDWLLTLRQGPDLASVWDNGSDGVAAPWAELRFHHQPFPEWRLVLRVGSCLAVYSRLAQDWNWLGANTLYLQPGASAFADRLPPSLQLVPA